MNTAVQSGNFEVVEISKYGCCNCRGCFSIYNRSHKTVVYQLQMYFSQDSIPQGTLFIENSVFVNGSTSEGAHPEFDSH